MSLFLQSISLSRFRNYSGLNQSFNFHKQFVFIIGPNAIGKSNLLEAIQYASIHAENLVENEKQLLSIHSPDDRFQIEANYSLGERNLKLEICGGASKSLKINGVKYRSAKEAKSEMLKSVIFKARESLEIVRGSPNKRRDWLNGFLSILDIHYADCLKRYERALDQRNYLLKSSGYKSQQSLIDELNIWDMELAKYAIPLQQARKRFIETSNPSFQNAYRKISSIEVTQVNKEVTSGGENPCLKYLPSIELNGEQDNEETYRQNVQTLSLEDNMRNQWLEKFQNNREIDLARYQTTQGSHRDDFAFQINEMDARYYASQGQQRTCALSLKLTQLEKWAEHLEYSPILLLDDVCAELDLNRQKALFEFLPKKSQVFITTTHLSSLPPMPADKYQIINL